VILEGWVINPFPNCVAWAALYRVKILANLLALKEQSARNYCLHFLRQEERGTDEKEQWKSRSKGKIIGQRASFS
jgi:hypothetical protein